MPSFRIVARRMRGLPPPSKHLCNRTISEYKPFSNYSVDGVLDGTGGRTPNLSWKRPLAELDAILPANQVSNLLAGAGYTRVFFDVSAPDRYIARISSYRALQ